MSGGITTMQMNPIPYIDINTLLDQLLAEVQVILGKKRATRMVFINPAGSFLA
jgi:hypothetical protein